MYKLKFSILFILGILILPASKAQGMFYSQLLQNLYNSLPETCKIDANKTDTVVFCRDIVPGNIVSIAYCYDENKILEHIGYRFLQNSDSDMLNNVIVRFIEREFLSLLLATDINQTLISHRENGLSMLLNDKPIQQSVLQDKRTLLNLLKNNRGIAINFVDGKKYEVSLLLDKMQKLLFRFPADSELITGLDKKERDIRLAVQLKNHRVTKNSIAIPDYSYLRQLRDSIYVEKGSSFMIPQINNDLFFVKTDNRYNLAFDKSLIAESFANALLVPVKKNYQIDITHRMYGKTVKKYMVSSRTFDDYFRRDFDRYFGIESLEKEKLTGTMILKDRFTGCLHLAFVSIPLDDLLNGGTMELQLYSNIPQHNMNTLFGK